MRPTAPTALRLIFLVTGVMLMVAGCSFTRLGYQNLEWLVSWKVNDYVTLDREQKRWLRSEVKNLHTWHCATELPRYTTLLASIRDELLADQPDAAALQARLGGMGDEAARTLRKLTPTLITLAASLSDQQVEELTGNLAKKQLEHRNEYTRPDLSTQNQERSDRMQKRMRRWFGPLNSQQIDVIDEWALALQGQSQLWLDNRDLWLGALQETLEHRHAADFAPRLEALVMRPQDSWRQTYVEQRERSIALAAELLRDVAMHATQTQQQHLVRQSNAYIDDMERIRCPPTNG